jgi:hypothetical protein
MGISRLDMVSNVLLLEADRMPSMEELLRERRLWWLGNLARMGAERFAKQLLFAHVVPRGRRRVGRPHHMWSDAVRADMSARQHLLAGRDWFTVSQNRKEWEGIAKGVYMQ